MKNSILTAAALTMMLVCSATALSAKNLVKWKGGTTGQGSIWNCPRNWSSYKVPDEFSNVVILMNKALRSAPVIYSGN